MKILKNDLSKKLIIVLIVLLLFNTIYPTMTFAWDFGGILMKPLVAFILASMVPSDIVLGMLIKWSDFKSDTVENVSSAILNVGGKNSEQYDEFKDYFVGPDSIFAGEISAFNANIFNQVDSEETTPWVKASKAVAKFYVILRNISGLVMLIGLIFTGIRILLSSNIPTKKTQYLMMLQDWVIGMGLLIFSHIIMILIMEFTDAIVAAVRSGLGANNLKWELVKNATISLNSATQIISLIMYGWILWLTVIFAIAYFKRYFWTCILVIFAPVVSVMYAFGQQTKQIYTNWLKEFIMNAMVKPFHLVVYTVLVMLPIQTTGGETGFSLTGWSITNLVYPLMAMSMIRPAEKYLRNLFGLNRGIANMASYDSGKQVVDTVVKTAVAVGAVVATGGAAAGAMAAGGAGTALAGAASSAAAGGAETAVKGMTDMAGAASKVDETLGDASANTSETNMTQALLDEENEKFGTSDWDSAYANQLASENAPFEYNAPVIDDAQDYLKFKMKNEGFDSLQDMRAVYSDEDLNYELEQLRIPTVDNFDDFDLGDVKAVTDGIEDAIQPASAAAGYIEGEDPKISARREALEEQLADGQIDENDLSDEDKRILGRGDKEELSAAVEEGLSAPASTGQENSKGNMNVSSLNITAGSVNMQGELAKGSEQAEIKEAKVENENNENNENSENNDNNGNNDQKTAEDDGISITPPPIDTGEVFKNLGGFEQIGQIGIALFEGLNSLTDGLYVDGGAPTNEWKGYSQMMQGNMKIFTEKRKENLEQEKQVFVSSNLKEEMKILMPEIEKRYPEKTKEYRENVAKKEAQEKLTKMAEFVPYGVSDLSTAQKLYSISKNNGLTAEQTIQYVAAQPKYEKAYSNFNTNKDFVATINLSGKFDRNDYKTVEEAIPNARTYYDNGYKHVEEMAWLEKMRKDLNQSPEFAIRAAQALKKKGKVNYSGKNPEMKKIIDDINSTFGG